MLLLIINHLPADDDHFRFTFYLVDAPQFSFLFFFTGRRPSFFKISFKSKISVQEAKIIKLLSVDFLP